MKPLDLNWMKSGIRGMKNKWIWSGLMVTILLFSYPALAATTPDTSSFPEVSRGFFHFFQNIQQVLQAIFNDSNITNFADTLFKFFSFISLIWFFVLYTMHDASVSKLFTVIFMILLTRVLMNQYDMITTALWGWSEGFAGGIQMAATGRSDLFWLAHYIWNTCTKMSFGSPALFYHPLAFLASVVMTILTTLLVCLSSFVTVWALWGYALMKMIGFMFIPCILFENLSRSLSISSCMSLPPLP